MRQTPAKKKRGNAPHMIAGMPHFTPTQDKSIRSKSLLATPDGREHTRRHPTTRVREAGSNCGPQVDGVWLGSMFVAAPKTTAREEHGIGLSTTLEPEPEIAPQRQLTPSSVDNLRLLVGRERQRLLGLLQDKKPAVKKVSRVLQKLAHYTRQHPECLAADWLSSEYVGQSCTATETQNILCVGCGDGSYELSLLLAGATGMVVTFFESEAKLRSRYSSFVAISLVLRHLGAIVLFEVDATRLLGDYFEGT